VRALFLNQLAFSRFLLAGSCLSFLLALTACGGGDSASVSSTSATQSSTTSATQSSPRFLLAQSKSPKLMAPKGSSSGDAVCTDSSQTVYAWTNTTAYTFKFSATTGSKANPTAVTTIAPGATLQNVNGLTWSVNVYDSAGQSLLYTTTATLWCNTQYTYILDSQYKIVWTYNTYQNNQSWLNMTIDLAPPVVTNTGWSNGMGNSLSTATSGNSFWGIDYGSESGRWTATSGAIYQLNQGIAYNGGTNYGSRAYPVALGTDFAATSGPGGAKDGLWQIDIKVGTSGSSDNSYVETFYLAERKNPAVGTANYMDGSPKGGQNNAPGGWGLEIDIMETRWNAGGTKVGPQINLPTGLGDGNTTFTGWTTDSTYYNAVLGLWADIGGAPNASFATYGALIRGNSLWIYAYKPDGTVWYSTPEIKNSGTYAYSSPLYPYIGTWADPSTLGSTTLNVVSSTGYNNYIYLAANDPKIAGYNPKDNPEKFGKALVSSGSAK